jgi:hypothetical protein
MNGAKKPAGIKAASHSRADLTAALSQSDAAGSFRIEFIVGLRFSAISSAYCLFILKSTVYWIAKMSECAALISAGFPLSFFRGFSG